MQSLEEKYAALEKEVLRQKAVYEVQNLMNKYEWLLPACKFAEVMNLFALDTPGVRAEIGSWGVYEGREGIRKLLGPGGFHEWLQMKNGQPQPGAMFCLPNTTCVVEVAKDMKTAKGVWLCSGFASKPATPGGPPQGYWEACKRAADFIVENGVWKIWHYHVYGIFMTPFETSWTNLENPEKIEAKAEFTIPENMRKDKPTTHPNWTYTPKAAWEYVPAAPDPYDTFDEKNAY